MVVVVYHLRLKWNAIDATAATITCVISAMLRRHLKIIPIIRHCRLHFFPGLRRVLPVLQGQSMICSRIELMMADCHICHQLSAVRCPLNLGVHLPLGAVQTLANAVSGICPSLHHLITATLQLLQQGFRQSQVQGEVQMPFQQGAHFTRSQTLCCE